MREIKFRAYHKKLGLIRDLDFINFSNANFCGVWKTKPPEDLFSVVTTVGDLWNLEDVELMQFVGLTDKNGVEIYEGDILKVANGSINGKIMFQIYEVDYKLPYGFSKSLPLFCWDEKGVYDGRWSHYCEVIGNIYENEELLTK